MHVNDFLKIILVLYIFDCAGSSLLCGLFYSFGEWGLLSVAASRLLIAVVPLVEEHGLEHVEGSVVAAPGL